MSEQIANDSCLPGHNSYQNPMVSICISFLHYTYETSDPCRIHFDAIIPRSRKYSSIPCLVLVAKTA